MYKRYKDDINMVLKIDREKNTTDEIMERMKEIADGIDECLSVKTDVTDNYEDGRLPILDLKVWIGRDEKNENKILHTHYMKDVSSKKVIPKKSAHGERVKKNVIVNDLCRVMRNCSDRMGKNSEEKRKNVEMYLGRMQFSGYDKKDKYETVTKAMKIHEEEVKTKTNYM